LVLSILPDTAFGAEILVYEDMDSHVAGRSAVATIDQNSAFGEKTDLDSGSTSFYVTVASIPGNNDLDVALRYKYVPYSQGSLHGWRWERDVPYIVGEFAAHVGWVVGTYPNTSDMRCSHPGLPASPPEVPSDGGKAGTFLPEEYWNGYRLVLPGGRSELLNPIWVPLENQPTSGGPFYWATNSGWFFSCIPPSGGKGEGFLGHSPDGKKYFFSGRSTTPMPDVLKKYNYLGETLLHRWEVRMTLDRVEDRFGNYVQGLNASDGRQITENNLGNGVYEVSDGSRQWTYTVGDSEFRIEYPDGSQWKLELAGGFTRNSYGGASCSNTQIQKYSGSAQIQVTIPSGANAVFEFEPRQRGFSYVPFTCYRPVPGSDYFVRTPNVLSEISLIKKTVSGPGLDTFWSEFDYGPLNNCYSNTGSGGLPACTAASPIYRTTTISRSDNTFTRYAFGNKAMENQGQLLRIEEGSISSGVQKSTANSWALFDMVGGAAYGGTEVAYSLSAVRRLAISEKVVTMQEQNFIWRVASDCGPTGSSLCFDDFIRPTKVIRRSSPVP